MDNLLNALLASDIYVKEISPAGENAFKISIISEIEDAPSFWGLTSTTTSRDNIDIIFDFNRKVVVFNVNGKNEREFRPNDFSDMCNKLLTSGKEVI